MVVSSLQNIIHDQVLEGNSMGMSVSNLKNLRWNSSCEIQHCVRVGVSRTVQGIFQLIEVTTITVQRNLLACIVDETHIVETWTGLW